MTVTHKELDLGMSLFLELIQADPSLAPIVAQARTEYFPGGAGFSGDPRSAPPAEIRFFEWFLFERDHNGGLLVEELLPAWREMADAELEAFESTFLGTCAGIYEVGDEAEGGIHWLRDIAGLGEFAVEVRVSEGVVQTGDLIVGRLFPKGDSTHVLSPGAGYFREETLISAVYRDLEFARRDRSHKALKIRQEDLEAMFWGDALTEQPSDPVADLRAFLQQGGLSTEEVDGLIEILSSRPLPEDTSGPFFISAIQDLLDHLAFDTEIDLGEARGKFLACWIFLQADQNPEFSAEASSDLKEPIKPHAALEAFDADRESGFDAETAISRLSSRLGLGEDEDSESEDSGGLGAECLLEGLIEEYFWDIERDGSGSNPFNPGCFQMLREELKTVEVIEDITPRRLLLLACTKLCDAKDLNDEERSAYATILGEFSRWCVEHQGNPDSPEVREAFKTLPDSIKRVSWLNQSLDSSAISGDWLSIVVTDGELTAKTAGGEVSALKVCAELDGRLVEGDYARGSLSDDGAELRWIYPAEISAAQ